MLNASFRTANSLIKPVVNWLLGDYQIYRIYRYDLADFAGADLSEFMAKGYSFGAITAEEVSAAADAEVRERAFYGGQDALGFAIFHQNRIVCLQWYWFAERYRQRNFWPLEDDQAKSVDLYTVPDHRGKGLATALKVESARVMKDRGFRQLFSRIWYSHRASVQVSEKAGWYNVAIVAELYPLRLHRKLRFVWRLGPRRD